MNGCIQMPISLSYVAEVVRASFSSLGIAPQTNPAALAIVTSGTR